MQTMLKKKIRKETFWAEGIFDHEFKKSVAKITLPIYKLRNA